MENWAGVLSTFTILTCAFAIFIIAGTEITNLAEQSVSGLVQCSF